MEWIFLFAAGLLEVFWSTCLKLSEGFSVIKFSILTVIGMIFSFLFLAQATKTLPLGTSYAIWTGIGALGAVIVGILLFKESCSPVRLLFVAFLLVGSSGLRPPPAIKFKKGQGIFNLGRGIFENTTSPLKRAAVSGRLSLHTRYPTFLSGKFFRLSIVAVLIFRSSPRSSYPTSKNQCQV